MTGGSTTATTIQGAQAGPVPEEAPTISAPRKRPVRPIVLASWIALPFSTVFATFYALASWALCSTADTCISNWVAYLLTTLVVWGVTVALVGGGVMSAVWFYRLTKV